MLTIQDGQMQALAAQMERGFEQRAADAIQQFFPDEVKQLRQASGGDEKFRALIRTGSKRAANLGITEECDVAAFLMLVFAQSHFKDGWKEFFESCRPIIEAGDLTGQAKMALIEHQLQRDAGTDERAALISGMIMQLRGKG